MSSIIEYLTTDSRIQEIVIRSILVLCVAEGLRVSLRSAVYQTRKYTKAEVRKMSEVFGIVLNLLAATWLSWYFSNHKPLVLILSEGAFYGFGTVFLHWILMKYLDRKLYKEKI